MNRSNYLEALEQDDRFQQLQRSKQATVLISWISVIAILRIKRLPVLWGIDELFISAPFDQSHRQRCIANLLRAAYVQQRHEDDMPEDALVRELEQLESCVTYFILLGREIGKERIQRMLTSGSTIYTDQHLARLAREREGHISVVQCIGTLVAQEATHLFSREGETTHDILREYLEGGPNYQIQRICLSEFMSCLELYKLTI